MSAISPSGLRFVLLLAVAAAPSLVPAEDRPVPALPLLDGKAFDRAAAAHLLTRAGFAAGPGEVERFAALGLEKAVETLLDTSGPDPLPFEPMLTERLSRAEIAKLKTEERKQAARDQQRKDAEQFQKLRGWWLRRMAITPRPLEEKMTLFWHGHFATSQRDVRNSYHMYLQNRLLRSHALGNFKDLVRAVAKDPAMLEYLDNNRNNRRAPNENFARELLELFTLGIGNYTEKDIKEAARALTGWTFEGNRFIFREGAHDPGEKTFLGKTGKLTGDEVVDLIFEQPAASRFISGKLFVYFAHENPPAEAVEALAATLRESRWEVRPLLSRLFRSAAFYAPHARGSQVKSPVQLVVGTARLLGINPGDSPALAALAGQMGQDLFLPPSVKGWDGGKSWISTSSLFDRYNFARPLLGLEGASRPERGGKKDKAVRGLARGKIPAWDPKAGAREILGEDPEKVAAREAVERVAARFLLVPLAEDKRAKLTEFYQGAGAETRLAELIHLVLSTPEYQLN